MQNNPLEEITLSLMIPFILLAFFKFTPTESVVGQSVVPTYRAKATLGQGAAWNIAEGYEIQFLTRGAEGSFSNLAGNIRFDEDNLSDANFDVTVEVETINTGNKKKDGHALGKKWLDAISFPKISFVSSSIEKNGKGFLVTGTLDLRGIKKEITFPFQFTKEENRGLFEGNLTINRADYNIDGPMMAFMVGSEVTVKLKVPVKQ